MSCACMNADVRFLLTGEELARCCEADFNGIGVGCALGGREGEGEGVRVDVGRRWRGEDKGLGEGLEAEVQVIQRVLRISNNAILVINHYYQPHW